MSCGRWYTTNQTRQRRGGRVRERDLGVGEGMLERKGDKETNGRTSTCTLGTRFSVLGSSTATYGFQASGVENLQTVSPPLHYSASRKDLDVLHQAHTEPREETASNHRSISRTPNQPQYEFSHHPSRSNAHLLRPILTVFKLPDKLILSILSHISPDSWLTRNYSCSCIPYNRICNFHGQRGQSLRPLSMTCRLMRLRFLPLIWEYIALSRWNSGETLVFNLNVIANALHADKFVATSVKYFRAFLYSRLGTDSCPTKVHEGAFHTEYDRHPSVR